jgi:hypothetical protein
MRDSGEAKYNGYMGQPKGRLPHVDAGKAPKVIKPFWPLKCILKICNDVGEVCGGPRKSTSSV